MIVIERVLAGPDRRSRDRRDRTRFRWRERRSGFDKRHPAGAFDPARVLRDRPGLLFGLLWAVNGLSVLDLVLTLVLVRAGAREANPLLAHLIQTSPPLAALVKVAMILAVTTGIWVLRRYRLVLLSAVFAFVAFSAVLLYQLTGAFTLL